MNENKAYIYDAFISYRHTQPDKEVAEKLHKLLETYRVPKSIAKAMGKKKINRVFRDRDELPTSSNLADNITMALENSEFLIVICSPRTPLSQWVLKEIETFSKLHGHDRILALLIEGEPEQAFPAELRYRKERLTHPDGTVSETLVEIEPLAADIRASSTQEMFKKLKNELLRLLAPMLRCKYDDLKQRHKERLIKNILTASISLSAFFLAFGSFSTYQALIINQKSLEVIKHSQRTLMTQSLYLADISQRLLSEGDRYRAILVALEALPKDLEAPDRPYVHEAELALSQALGVYDIDIYFDPDKVIDHDKPINFLVLSPDRKTLLTSCRDGFLYTWNIEDGTRLGSFDLNRNYPDEGTTYFLDNNRILTSDENEQVLCIDLQGNRVWESESKISKSAISPDKLKLATTYRKDTLTLLDTQTGAIISQIDLSDFLTVSEFDNYITTLAFNGDGTKVGIGISSGKVVVIDLASSSITTYNTGYSQVDDLVFTPEGEILIASNLFDINDLFGSTKGMLQKFSLDHPEALQTWTYPFSHIMKLTLNPSNTSQLVFLEGEKINVLDLATGELLYTFIHGDTVTQYEVNKDLIVSSSYDGTIRFWLMQNSGIEGNNYRITRPSSINRFARTSEIVAFSHHNENKVYLFKTLNNKNTLRLPGHTEYVIDGKFSPDGSLAMTRNFLGGELFLWDTQNKQILRSVNLDESISEATFTSDGSHIAVLMSKKALLLRTSDLSIEKELSSSYQIQFNASSSRIVESDGTQSTLYDMDTFDKINTYNFRLRNALFTHKGHIIQYDSYKKILSSHDADTGNQTTTIENIDITTHALTNDGTLLAAALKDKTIKLYNVDSGFREVLTLSDVKHPATMLTFSPDSKLLYIGLDDYSVVVYSTDDGQLKGTIELGDELKRIIYSADGEQVLLIATGKAQLWNLSAFKQVATIDRVLDIDKNFQTLLSNWTNETIFMPLYNTQMLLDEAKLQLNGRVLNDKERKTLFIEP